MQDIVSERGSKALSLSLWLELEGALSWPKWGNWPPMMPLHRLLARLLSFVFSIIPSIVGLDEWNRKFSITNKSYHSFTFLVPTCRLRYGT
jgi:hypothetical protein